MIKKIRNSLIAFLALLVLFNGLLFLLKPQTARAEETEITSDMVFFQTGIPEIKSGKSYCLKTELKIKESVSHLLENISVSFLMGADAFELRENEFRIEDGKTENGYIIFDITLWGDVYDIKEKVKLKADINYSGKTIEIESPEMDIITHWTYLIEDGYIFPTSHPLIEALVNGNKNSFESRINNLKNEFTIYNEEEFGDSPIEELIFKVAISDEALKDTHGDARLRISWDDNGQKNTELFIIDFRLKDAKIEIYIDEEYKIDREVLANIDICIKEENLYVRLNKNFAKEGVDIRNIYIFLGGLNSPSIYVAEAETNLEEYNKELLNQIETLRKQLAEANKKLDESYVSKQELIERVTLLEESIANLETAYSKLELKYNALNQQYINALSEAETLKVEKNEAVEKMLLEIDAHKTTKETLEEQIAEKDGNIESLQAQLNEVNAELTEKIQILETLQSELSLLEKRYEELSVEYQAFMEASNGELQAVSGIIHEYKITVSQLEKQVSDLEEQLEEQKQKEEDRDSSNGCSSGCNGSGGSGSGTGSGVDSTLTMTTLGMALFAGVVYAKRTRTKKE